MRTNSDTFNQFNRSLNKGLRLVLKIDFPTPLYLASHDDIPNIPAGTLPHTIKNVSSVSQKLNPDTGRSEIGSIRLDIVDVNGGFSARLNTEDAAGEGLTDRKVELFRGGEGMDWSDFRLEQTQQISQSLAYDKGGYKVQCADIQRAMRSDIFDLAVTKLSADFDAGAATINVFDTSDFEACTHVASFGDQPTGSFFYFKIKYENGFEIIRATGKTATSFTGCARGRFGTTDVDHVFPIGEDQDSSVEIEEYVYLELPAPAMAHALLTGALPGGGTIPTRWNLGISTSNVDEDSFENIGEDWYDSSDYTKGLIFRFQGVDKTDGKRFIEREVCMLAGMFMYVKADGKLYLKRMTGVLSSSDYIAELTPDNIVKHGPLKHNLSRVRNTFDIEWSWVHFPSEEKPRYARRNILVDGTSQSIHGESKTHTLRFRGLHNERHTYTTIINRFDALRDRFAGPPLTISIDLLPHMNDLEVGDIVRVHLPNVKEYVGGGFLDRSMEIQRITVDQRSGRIRAQLFGSSLKAEPIVDNGAGANSELPDGWYDSEGTDFATAGLSIDGAGILQSSGSLTGGTTTRTIFYYLGDFTIPSGMTLTCSGNVELRIRGQLQVNGTLRASGGMPIHNAGFIGFTYGGRVRFFGHNPPNYPDYRYAPYSLQGRYDAMPVLEIENNSGVLAGIPSDMRGSSGGKGGDVMYWNSGDVTWEQRAAGGNGGGGGGSVVTVSRGMGFGVSGVTNVGGFDGSLGGVGAAVPAVGVPAGSGGGGAPGCAVHLIDGSGVTFPILVGNIDGTYGTSPMNVGVPDSQGKATASNPVDLGIAVARAQYVPKSRDPYPDYENDDLGSSDGRSVYNATVYQRAAAPPATPTADDGSYDFGTGILTPPSGWSVEPPTADGNPLYISTGQFSAIGPNGVDGTVVWTATAEMVSDGPQGDAGGDGNSVYYASCFIRASSAPSTPTGGQYNFGTKVLTPPSGWSDTPPAVNGDALYVSNTIAEVNGTTGIDSTLTWSTPAELVNDGADGSDGAAGSDGLSVHVSNVYRRSATAPITPTGGQYDFGTNTLTPPSLWFADPPAGTDPLYVSTGSWSVQGTTGVDSSTTWTAPAIFVQDGDPGDPGDPGADGQQVRTVSIYRLNSNAINSSSGTYADPLAGNTSWAYDVPGLATNGDIVYVAVRTLTDDAASPQDANWSTPAIYAQREDGVDGDDGGTGPAGDDGRDGVVIGGVKPNFNAFSTPNNGEMYVHGLDANGDPADVDGSYIFEGVRATLARGYINTNNQVFTGFIVLETGAGSPFTGASSIGKMAGCRLTVEAGVATWEYDNNTATWQSFTATATMIIIGTYTHPSATDLIETATLVAPVPLGTGVIDAAVINAANLRAISATIGQLETRAVGGSPTTPRLVLQDSQSPLQIFDDDDATSLLELKNTEAGFRIDILGDFIAASIDSSQMFSEDGITHLRGRLGLSDPSQGTGGSLSGIATTAYSGTLNVDKLILIDQLPKGAGAGVIESGGNDVTLFWKLYYSSQGFNPGLPGFSAGQWTVKLQYKKNTDAWVDVPTASWVVTGNLQVWGNGTSEPYEWSYNINEEREHVWTGALALNDYVYRVAVQCDSGSTLGSMTVMTANEPLAGAGVLEAHTHEADDIDFGVLAADRIPTHTGEVVGQTNLTLANSAITGQAALTSGLVSTDEMLISDAGVLKRMDISVLETYMQAAIGGDPGAEFFRHITSGYNSADVSVSATAPGSPAQGDIWFDTAGGSYDADTLDGLDAQAPGNSPPSGREVLTSHTNGYVYVGWLNTVSGTAGTITRVYCSQDAFLRYLTPANFVAQLDNVTAWNFTGAQKPRVDNLGMAYYGTAGYVGGKMSVQSSAPTSPTQGDIWFDTT